MFDQWIHDLNKLIDRRFAATRTLVVEPEGDRWTASIGDDVLYRSYDGAATLRFARAFCQRNRGVLLEVAEIEDRGDYSVRVDNVIALRS